MMQDQVFPITPEMLDLLAKDKALREKFDLKKPEGRRQFLIWFFQEGSDLLPLEKTQYQEAVEPKADHQRIHQWLRQSSTSVIQDQRIPLTELLCARLYTRPDLTRKFDLNESTGRKLFVDWCLNEGWEDFLKDFIDPQINFTIPQTKKGVNIIGYTRAELGLGEDARMVALALESVHYPVAVYPIIIGHGLPGLDLSTCHLEDLTLPHPISIFHFPGMEEFDFLRKFGVDTFQNRYSIGYWAWELEEWPKELMSLYRMNREIWTISNFVKNSFLDSGETKVLVVPQTVEVPLKVEPFDLAPFGVKAGTFVFSFSFSFNSSIHRKNPDAVIQAFQKAFTKNENVALVIKVINGSAQDPVWVAFENRVKQDPRIVLINRPLSREDTFSLMKASDCFVSLHRSEGFGRGMAEAMLLGVPCIVTNYSGNTDFCNETNTMLVDYKKVPVRPGEYHYLFDHQNWWAEPSVDHATHHMLEVFNDANLRARLSENGKKTIQDMYSFQKTSAFYNARLDEIQRELQI